MNESTIPATLTVAEARELTDEVIRRGDAAWRSRARLEAAVREAHDREAWRPLDYPNWTTYCRREFGFSKSHGYLLINAATDRESLRKEVDESAFEELFKVLNTDCVIAIRKGSSVAVRRAVLAELRVLAAANKRFGKRRVLELIDEVEARVARSNVSEPQRASNARAAWEAFLRYEESCRECGVGIDAGARLLDALAWREKTETRGAWEARQEGVLAALTRLTAEAEGLRSLAARTVADRSKTPPMGLDPGAVVGSPESPLQLAKRALDAADAA